MQRGVIFVLRPFLSKGYKVTSGKKNGPRSKGNRRKTGRAESSAVKIESASQIVAGCLTGACRVLAVGSAAIKNFPPCLSSRSLFLNLKHAQKNGFYFGNRNEFMRLLSGF